MYCFLQSLCCVINQLASQIISSETFLVSQHMSLPVANLGKSASIDQMLFGDKIKAFKCAERSKKDILPSKKSRGDRG